ncbi:MAG: hypothetical protein P1V36_06080, partial [Planctomycetota bacterium]|nr:hypothetical protein [Planctomycetota bacterium]
MRLPKPWHLLAVAVLVLALPSMVGGLRSAHAADDEDVAAKDTLIHTNGSVWEGRILQETDEQIVLERVSKSGGVGRITFPRADIKLIRRGRPDGAAGNEGGPRLVREEWFLLRSSGRIIGTRRLELWAVRSRGEPGFRLEEAVEYFAQGPQLPATRTHRTEE